jgi:hypothetical protein
MEIQLTFARHYARLVWLLLYDSESYEAQLASLGALVSASKAGPVTIQARDWRLAVNGELVPESYPGAQDLTAQLIGHSILEFTLVQDAALSDMLLFARILASEPVPGDGGKNVLGRLRAIDARSVPVKVETLPAPRGATASNAARVPGMIPDISLFTAAPTREGVAAEAHNGRENESRVSAHEGELLDDQDPEQMFHVVTANSTPKGSMTTHFEQLDAARTPAAATASRVGAAVNSETSGIIPGILAGFDSVAARGAGSVSTLM